MGAVRLLNGPRGCLGNRGTVRSGPIATQWPGPEARHCPGSSSGRAWARNRISSTIG